MDAPIVTATWQGAALSGFSNILGQAIGCYQDNASSLTTFLTFLAELATNITMQIPVTINFADLAYFTLFTILNTPPNFLWQMFLEDQFPGYTTDNAALKDKATTTKPSLNKRNTAIKFALDQTVGAAVNTIFFLGGMALLRGQPWEEVVGRCREGFWPLIFAGQKLWPFVSIAMFTLVPAELRTVVGSIVGMFWNIYLTLVSGRSSKVATE